MPKFYLDTEFIEGLKPFRIFGIKIPFVKPVFTIQLVSVGIVSENGNTYYAVSSDYNFQDANDWVKKNVITNIYCEQVHGDLRNTFDVGNFHQFVGKPNWMIALDIKDYIYRETSIHPATTANFDEMIKHRPIEFNAYFADYDWVVFCSLFGTMMDLPKGFPMYCRDLKQEIDRIARHVMFAWRLYGFFVAGLRGGTIGIGTGTLQGCVGSHHRCRHHAGW